MKKWMGWFDELAELVMKGCWSLAANILRRRGMPLAQVKKVLSLHKHMVVIQVRIIGGKRFLGIFCPEVGLALEIGESGKVKIKKIPVQSYEQMWERFISKDTVSMLELNNLQVA